jgi:peroxiredoxin
MRNNGRKGEKGGGTPPLRPLPRTIFFVALFLFSGILSGMGSKPPQLGSPAPPFQTETVEGEPATLSNYRGKVVLLTFWASWCEPCKKEMPEIQAAYEKHKENDLVVLAVNFGEKQEAAKAFVDQMGLTFPALMDRRANIAERYAVVSLPVTFFIDKNGIIRERVFGGTLTEEDIGKVFQRVQGKE